MLRVALFSVLASSVLVSLASAACIFPPKVGDGTGGGAGGGGGGHPGGGGEGGASGDGGTGPDAAAVGTMCDVPTTAGGMLCEGVNKCKGLTVNQNTWMGCGFVTSGTGFSLVCECSGYICPVSATPTCAAAQLILERESAAQVCDQLDDGGCGEEFLAGADAAPAKCDPNCSSQCVGNPSCLAGCGC